MQGRWFVHSSSGMASFSPNSLCLSMTLTQIFDLHRTEYLPLPGVTCVALWFLFAKELLLCPRMKEEVAAGTCL